MDRRTTLAIVLCFLIFMGWERFYVAPRVQEQQRIQQQLAVQQASSPQALETAAATASSQGPAKSAAVTLPKAPRPSKSIDLALDAGQVVLGDGRHLIRDWKLKNYREGLAADSPAIALGSVVHETGTFEVGYDETSLAYLSEVQGSLTARDGGATWSYTDSNVDLVKEVSTVRNQPWLNVVLKATFKTKRPNFLFVSLSGASPEGDTEEADRNILYYSQNSANRVQISSGAKLQDVITPLRYAAITSRYFLTGVVNDGPIEPRGLIQPLGPRHARASLVYPVTTSTVSIPLKVYFGPKDLDTLRAVDPALDHAVDFGWFTFVAYPLLKTLRWIYGFVGNYGVAIILLTLLVRLAVAPLNYKSMKGMKDMARIQPQLTKLREKYADDKEALNREMLALMKSSGYNPVAGCLPMLVQMPVFLALYRVLYGSIELYHAPFGLWIHDLSLKDPLYITPLLLTGLMFLQQKLTPMTSVDPAQQKMMQFMPLMFGAFMISLPSGLAIYMLVSTAAGILQQFILNKRFNVQSPTGTPSTARS